MEGRDIPLTPPHPPPSALPVSWRDVAGERNYIDYCIDYNMANSPLPKAHILKSPFYRAFMLEVS